MSQKAEYHNLDKPDDGLFRELAPGLTTRIFAGEQAMLSVVTIAPNAEGKMHHHPEEQWGVLLEGSAIRFQGGEEIPVKKGDFWRTPGNVPHTMRAGPEGCARARHLHRRRGRNTGSRAADSGRREDQRLGRAARGAGRPAGTGWPQTEIGWPPLVCTRES